MAPKIDFLTTSTPYYLSVADFSSWELIEDKPSIIEITLPGHRKPIIKYFDKKKLNVYNSILLELNCFDGCSDPELVTLPDGVYTIKLIGSPSSFYEEKQYLKTDLFDMDIDKIYIDNIDKVESVDFLDQLTQIEFLMRGATAHLRYGNVKMTNSLFEKASDLLSKLKNCKDCHGMWMSK